MRKTVLEIEHSLKKMKTTVSEKNCKVTWIVLVGLASFAMSTNRAPTIGSQKTYSDGPSCKHVSS
jgi:hypothetical protein